VKQHDLGVLRKEKESGIHSSIATAHFEQRSLHHEHEMIRPNNQ
jgi:hypothetical protein